MAVLRGPDEMQMAAIRTELGETEEQFEENMKIIKNWMKNQSHIPNDCGTLHAQKLSSLFSEIFIRLRSEFLTQKSSVNIM